MPGELLFHADVTARQEPLAGRQPAGEGEQGEPEQGAGGPVGGGGAPRRDRSRGTVRPRSEQAEELEQRQHPGPEAESAARRPQRRRERDATPPATGEEVDGGGEERQQ